MLCCDAQVITANKHLIVKLCTSESLCAWSHAPGGKEADVSGSISASPSYPQIACKSCVQRSMAPFLQCFSISMLVYWDGAKQGWH